MSGKRHVNGQLSIDILYTSDKKAFLFLHDTFSPVLHGSIIELIETDKENASRMLDVAFSIAWKVLQSCDKQKQKLFVWMLHMLRRLTVKALQQCSAWPKADELERLSIGLRRKLLTMDRGQRCVIELMYDKGYSKARIARTLNIPVETVDNLLQASLNQLCFCLRAFIKTSHDENSGGSF